MRGIAFGTSHNHLQIVGACLFARTNFTERE
jgi:hypothetical protein